MARTPAHLRRPQVCLHGGSVTLLRSGFGLQDLHVTCLGSILCKTQLVLKVGDLLSCLYFLLPG